VGLEAGLQWVQQKMASNKNFLAEFAKELALARANEVHLPGGTGLEPTNDAFPIIHDKNCKFEQLANYTSQGQLVDHEIYSHLDELNLVAFYTHEAIYAMTRKILGDLSSIRARKLVAFLLASNANLDVINDLMKEITASFGLVTRTDTTLGFGNKVSHDFSNFEKNVNFEQNTKAEAKEKCFEIQKSVKERLNELEKLNPSHGFVKSLKLETKAHGENFWYTYATCSMQIKSYSDKLIIRAGLYSMYGNGRIFDCNEEVANLKALKKNWLYVSSFINKSGTFLDSLVTSCRIDYFEILTNP
jgi:hypothetical protein